MLTLVKLALRISGNAFDSEISQNIADAMSEIQSMGITIEETGGEPSDPQIKSAIISYCKWQFGFNSDAERWEKIYHTKLGQLQSTTGYTTWGA